VFKTTWTEAQLAVTPVMAERLTSWRPVGKPLDLRSIFQEGAIQVGFSILKTVVRE